MDPLETPLEQGPSNLVETRFRSGFLCLCAQLAISDIELSQTGNSTTRSLADRKQWPNLALLFRRRRLSLPTREGRDGSLLVRPTKMFHQEIQF